MTGGQLIALFALSIPIVAIVMANLTKWKRLQAQGVSDEALAAFEARAAKLDERVVMLEKILDAEAPGWRARA